jgi:oligopeptide/dipeptide ABC transporter ATP-binding protein
MSILRLVARPGNIKSGSIKLDGQDILSLDDEQMRRLRGARAGMVFQNPLTALNPAFTIGWQLREALRAHGVNLDDAAEERILAALRAVGMADPERQRDSYPHHLSGGMRQRVVIAMGMINEPSLLIADEPTTALDVTIQAQVLKLMKQLTSENGTGLLLITHNMGVIAKMCDRVAVMYAGEIVEEAPVDELFAGTLHPYTLGLLQSIPRPDEVRGELRTMKGLPPDMSAVPSGCRFAARCPLVEDQCLRAHPELMEMTPGHKVRCWVTQKNPTALSNVESRETHVN